MGRSALLAPRPRFSRLAGSPGFPAGPAHRVGLVAPWTALPARWLVNSAWTTRRPLRAGQLPVEWLEGGLHSGAVRRALTWLSFRYMMR